MLLQDVAFDSARSFEAWRESPAHRRSGRALREVADWLVADVEE